MRHPEKALPSSPPRSAPRAPLQLASPLRSRIPHSSSAFCIGVNFRIPHSSHPSAFPHHTLQHWFVRRALVTLAAARIPHPAVRLDPRGPVFTAAESQHQHTEAAFETVITVADLLVAESSQFLTAGARNDLRYSAQRIGQSRRSLRKESLVVVIVAVQDQIDVRIIQDLPDRLKARVASVPTRTEARLVPVRDGAWLRLVLQILLQPVFLRLAVEVAELAQHDDFAVEHDHVPGAYLVAVVSGAGGAGLLAEIGEVRVGRLAEIVVVAGGRVKLVHDAPLRIAPRRAEAIGELPRGAFLIRVVTEREYRIRHFRHAVCLENAVHQHRCLVIAAAVASGNVADAHEYRRSCELDHRGWRSRRWRGDLNRRRASERRRQRTNDDTASESHDQIPSPVWQCIPL